MENFRAFLITKETRALQDVPVKQLPAGDVLIRVRYSSLNYKDGLAVTGKPGVVRNFPMVPGIDLAGIVEHSDSPAFSAADEVVVTGCGLSETHWGGYAGMARVPAEWAIKPPSGMSLLHTMAIGTAGFTAMQCVAALEEHGAAPGGREIVVTGAGGGVGSVAIAILAKRGFRVVASTGRSELREYFEALGAADLVDRAGLSAPSKKPMESERWGGAVDSVGGETLAGLIRTMTANCSIASCGLAGGVGLTTTVLPFILRGVNLLGINSVFVSRPRREYIWKRLGEDLPLDKLDTITRVAPLSGIVELGEEILAGKIRGRTVIDVNA